MTPAAAPLVLLREQLWAPMLATGDCRVVVDPRPDDGWLEVERYRLVPDARRARLILPVAPAPVAGRLLTNYRLLRSPLTALARSVLGVAVGVGVPAGRQVLSVQVRSGASEVADVSPLTLVTRALGRRVHAATGVRHGDNRKATLHLVDDRGEPVGYAKVGWSSTTDAAVRAEARALRDIDGGNSLVRAPRVLAELEYGSHPILVTEPLPQGVRRARADLSAQEMFALTPVLRLDHPAHTGQVHEVRARLERELGSKTARDLASQALSLLDRLHADEGLRTPVTRRWHGDMAPWNMARDADQTLWMWDWESSQPDATAGLDALYWQAALARRGAEPGLQTLVERAWPHLVAAGVAPRTAWAVVAVYAVTVVERACALAAEAGSWDGARLGPAALAHLLRQANDFRDGPRRPRSAGR